MAEQQRHCYKPQARTRAASAAHMFVRTLQAAKLAGAFTSRALPPTCCWCRRLAAHHAQNRYIDVRVVGAHAALWAAPERLWRLAQAALAEGVATAEVIGTGSGAIESMVAHRAGEVSIIGHAADETGCLAPRAAYKGLGCEAEGVLGRAC